MKYVYDLISRTNKTENCRHKTSMEVSIKTKSSQLLELEELKIVREKHRHYFENLTLKIDRKN